jgi:hypothetical protein
MPTFTNIVTSIGGLVGLDGLELSGRTRARAIGELAGGLAEGLSGGFLSHRLRRRHLLRSLRNRLTPVEQFMLEPITRVDASPFAPGSSVHGIHGTVVTLLQ